MANKNVKVGDILRHNRDFDYYQVSSILEDNVSDEGWEKTYNIIRYSVNLLYSNRSLSQLYPKDYYGVIFCYEIDNDTDMISKIDVSTAEKEIKIMKLLYE